MRGEIISGPGDEMDDWPGQMYPGGARIDATNQTAILDSTMHQSDTLEMF